jgi:hypothetical protein
VTEFIPEGVIFGIGNLQYPVFHPEGVFVVLAQGRTFDLDYPTVEVLSVEELYPLFLWFCCAGGNNGGCYDQEQEFFNHGFKVFGDLVSFENL